MPAPTYKPTGLLQDFGEAPGGAGTELMKFGLITGSYALNTDGGVLRRTVGSIANEINTADGTFNTGVTGIIQTLNRLRTTGFRGSYQYNCGWNVTGPIIAGECQMWGNPIGEMMYEGLRYFAGKQAPTALFNSASVLAKSARSLAAACRLLPGTIPTAPTRVVRSRSRR